MNSQGADQGEGTAHLVRLEEHPDRPLSRGFWPRTIAAVGQVLDEGLDVPGGVTFLVGENGSGKSTLVEAMAAAYPRRGVTSAGPGMTSLTGPAASREDSPLARHLRVRTAAGASPEGFFLRAERMHDYLTKVDSDPDQASWWGGGPVQARSHGESFLTVLQQRFAAVGFYVLDEPEAALSFSSCLGLLALLADLRAEGSQVVCATHSPLLCALPGATVLELGSWGIRRTPWQDLELVSSWRAFLDTPHRYLRHLLVAP